MSEEAKKIENIEKKAEQVEQEVNADELGDKDLDKVSGGVSANTSKSNVRNAS